MTGDALHRKLRKLTGERFDYLGDVWILIEVLADVDSIVLRRCENCEPGSVQQNAYGIPNRRVANTLTLQISDPDSDGYSQDVLVLLEGRRVAPGSA